LSYLAFGAFRLSRPQLPKRRGGKIFGGRKNFALLLSLFYWAIVRDKSGGRIGEIIILPA
jgi:hypothetical protein